MKIRMLLLTILLLLPFYAYSMKVSFFLGDVTLERSGKVTPLKMGDSVGSGDIIKTGSGGMVELSYPNNSKITVQANTVIKIGSANIKDSDDISIISGHVKGKFERLQKGEYRFYTPTAVCSVRGTEFDVVVNRGGDSLTNLSQGALDIENFYGSVNLRPGRSVETEVNGKPVARRTQPEPAGWNRSRETFLEKNSEKQAERYSRYMDRFEQESDKNSGAINELGNQVRGIDSPDALEKSGESVVKTEEQTMTYLMLCEASNTNLRNLADDFKGNDIYEKFQEAAAKSNRVKDQQLRNYQEIQKVKQQYQEAYNKIMDKYKEDRERIFRGLQDFKKDMFKKEDPQ